MKSAPFGNGERREAAAHQLRVVATSPVSRMTFSSAASRLQTEALMHHARTDVRDHRAEGAVGEHEVDLVGTVRHAPCRSPAPLRR